MTDDLSDLYAELREMKRRIHILEVGTPQQNMSISRGALRVLSAEGLIVEGSARVNGTLIVTGEERVDGTLRVTGTLIVSGNFNLEGTTTISGPTNVTGDMDINGSLDINGPTNITGATNITGPTTITGTFDIDGETTITGDVTLDSDLDVRNGRILVGPMVIDRGSAFGSRIHSPSGIALSGSSVNVLAPTLNVNDLGVNGVATITYLDVTGTKNFRVDHPTKPGHWLRHGATESPVSGTEYTGRCEIDDQGTALVELPDYFEGLNKPDGRTVQLTPIGEPFIAGASEVKDGKFTVYGAPGRELFWLVKAERFGGDFPLEETAQQTPETTLEP